ncbi:MAG: DUF2254 domain-containing protein, partial [Myxococcales bacterium]|nr:DUF2254 domain-containing protein [Myxococcales bacterium]
MERLKALSDKLRASLWLIPACFVVAGTGLALFARFLDSLLEGSRTNQLLGAEELHNAQDVFSTVAGAMITVAGVAFSVVMVALVLASNQFNPRLLRNFLRDRTDQVTFGIFTGTFVYALISLVMSGTGPPPSASLIGVFVASLGSIGAFIYFIHHMTTSIQVSSLISSTIHETLGVIDNLFAERGSSEPKHSIVTGMELAALPGPDPSHSGCALRAREHDGYILRIDLDALKKAAEEEDVVVTLWVGPGDYVTRHQTLATADKDLEEEPQKRLEKAVHTSLVLGSRRDTQGDPAYGFRQLVDVALKAVSPGVNEPYTACNALDGLGTLLADLA